MADNYLITGYWGEPHVTAENDRGINAAMFGTGRFVLPVGEQFKAEYIGNNTIRVYDGKLMDNGAAAGIPVGEYVDLLIANAGQGMNRNDLIVFQYQQDSSTLVESGTFVVIQGEETTGTASDPTLTQGDLLSGNAVFDQMALWRVSVSAATISAPVKLFSLCNPVNMMDGAMTDNLPMGNHKITGLATPTADTDAATKAYADTKHPKATIVTTTGTDLNDYTEEGVYFFSSSYTPTNIPSGANGWLEVYHSFLTYSYVKQIWYRMGTPGSNDHQTFVRTLNPSTGVWGDWARYYTSGDTIPVDNGGTAASTASDALKNLNGITSGTPYSSVLMYNDMQSAGLGTNISTSDFMTAMPIRTALSFTVNSNGYFTDLPCDKYGQCVLYKGYNENYRKGQFFTNNGEVLVYDSNYGWRYLNPKMTAGTEYLLAEQYNGKPVYAKAVSLSLAGSGYKSVAVSSEMTEVVSIEGYYLSGSIRYTEQWTNILGVQVNQNGALQINSGDLSTTTAQYIVKYIK